jgi:hypothetical protein
MAAIHQTGFAFLRSCSDFGGNVGADGPIGSDDLDVRTLRARRQS